MADANDDNTRSSSSNSGKGFGSGTGSGSGSLFGSGTGTGSGSGSGRGSGTGSRGDALLPPLARAPHDLDESSIDRDDILPTVDPAEPITYGAYMHPLNDDSLKTPITVFSVTEVRNGGWAGEVIVLPPPDLTTSVEDAFVGSMVMDIMPGNGVLLHLMLARNMDLPGARSLRTWPSAILSVQTIRGTQEYAPAYRAQVGDPLTLLAHQRIWGVYAEESIGKIVGGAITLALGGSGTPTLTPAMGTSLPAVEIKENVRSELQSLPLSIAAGAEFGDWLRDLLARLGARIELQVDGNKVIVNVTDAKPTGDVLDLKLVAQHQINETDVAIVALGAIARENVRATVLDNRTVGDPERSHSRGSVGRVIDAMYLEAEEAWVRAEFEQENDFLGSSTVTIASRQSKLSPGGRIKLDEEVFGTDEWQVAVSLHKFTNGLYRNMAKLQRDGAAWRGRHGLLEDGVTITGIVDDGTSATGDRVKRDRLGRIPVRLAFLGEGEDVNRVSLPLLEAIGSGGTHGFVSAHRQGDPCRVMVHTPLNAEIVGFAYRQDGRIGERFVDATAGLVVRHESDGFSGLVFQPDEVMQSTSSSSSSGSDS